MEDHSIDVLVVQNNNDHMGGYVRYLCDLAAVNGGAVTVVFPRDDAMTLIMNGPFEGDRRLPSQGDGFLRGVGRVLTAPSFASVSYSRYYEAELAARALAPYAKGSIGLVCTYQMSLAMGQYLNRALDTVSWSEASELVDRVRAIKSTEEQERLKLTAALQDAAIGLRLRPWRWGSATARLRRWLGPQPSDLERGTGDLLVCVRATGRARP